MTNDKSKPGLPTYDQALELLLPHAPTLGEETIPLTQALGRVLRRALVADRDQPPFDRSAMDGFAVRSSEVVAGVSFPVIGTVAAGGHADSFQQEMAPGSVRRIATGAPLPRGADAVVPIELAAVAPGNSDSEVVAFSTPKVSPWQNVHRRASDATDGQMVAAAGTRLAPQHIGIAAAVGAVEVIVAQQPRITLLTTGDEVVSPGMVTAQLGPQQIRNSNGPMLTAMLAALGTPLLRHEHIPDDPELTRAAAREALSHSHLVITVGGVSVGQRDFLPSAWQHLGLETILHGVNIQPGKPLFVARDENKMIIGLPGNPISVLATAHLFVWPVLRKMLGIAGPPLWRDVRLAEPVKTTAKRLVFRAASLQPNGTAKVIQWHGSGDLIHTGVADGLVRLPMQEEPAPAGMMVSYLPMMGQ